MSGGPACGCGGPAEYRLTEPGKPGPPDWQGWGQQYACAAHLDTVRAELPGWVVELWPLLVYRVMRDGAERFRGSPNDCWRFVLTDGEGRPKSWATAIGEGWSLEPAPRG